MVALVGWQAGTFRSLARDSWLEWTLVPQLRRRLATNELCVLAFDTDRVSDFALKILEHQTASSFLELLVAARTPGARQAAYENASRNPILNHHGSESGGTAQSSADTVIRSPHWDIENQLAFPNYEICCYAIFVTSVLFPFLHALSSWDQPRHCPKRP